MVVMTQEELRELLDDVARRAATKDEAEREKTVSFSTSDKEYVYGLRGIANLFGISNKTAQTWKKTFLAAAVTQRGKTIITDVEMARRLFAQR
ncbi:MAG: DUF3853 family protein [Bacteroidales bacterium]|nr:DUF3853 family protein [Bacteroidales bacterium]